MLLGEIANDPTSLMAGERPIDMLLMLVEPLASDDICVSRPGNEALGPVTDECPILTSHGRTPLRVNQSTTVVDGLG